MNILIITPKIPYPLDEGGKISQFAVIDYLRKNNSVILVLTTYSKEDELNVSLLNNLWPEVTIETIKMVNTFTHFKKTFLKRLQNFLWDLLKSFRNRIKVSATRFGNKEEIKKCQVSELESPWIVQIATVKSSKFLTQLLNIINKFKIDIIQIDLLEDIDLALALPKDIKKVFVHHELKYARLTTTLKLLRDSSDPFNNYLLEFVKSQEINLLKLYDGIIVFGEDDYKKLAEAMPETKIFVSPFPVLDNFFRPLNLEFLKINKLVFVGGEEHTPNKDAIEWYINEIGDEVKKRQDLILHVVGKWSNETVKKYNGNKLVFFSGFVQDLLSYCENSIMVVPVRVGSGIRAKILYAMAQGVPVVSASTGCEGIGVFDKTDILIANNPQEFAEAIHSIVSNQDMTYNMVKNAQMLMRKKYSQKAAGELRQQYLNELINWS